MLSEKYQTEQQELDAKTPPLRSSMEADQQSVQDAENQIALIQKCRNIIELTDDMLNALIEKITVHETSMDTDGSRMQEAPLHRQE